MTNQTSQIAIVQALIAAGQPLNDLTLHLSNANIVVSPTTTLADLIECTFQGYFPVPAQTPPGVYVGADGAVHATYPTIQFVATNGQAQVMSNVTVGPITMSGTVTAIITAAGMTGSPRTVTVNVIAGMSNTDLADEVAETLATDADTGPFFNFTNYGNEVYAVRKTPAANDATMNMAFADGTAVGLVAKPTATQEKAGIAPGAFVPDQITAWFLTDATGSLLILAGSVTPNIILTSPPQGALITPDYPYGS